ncbi:MAG: ABC transporter permease, partial [Actinomycetia bacterium]|nr:ABC transporter permease [Actinomycetes bacterium]
IELTLVAMLIAIGTAVPLGVIAAVKKDTVFDRVATVVSMFGVSMPGFWFGLVLIMVFAVQLGLLPVAGRIGYGQEIPAVTHLVLVDSLIAGRLDSFVDALRHLALPALTLGLSMGAILMRVTRTSMLEVLSQDYVTFAEAKGLSRMRVLGRHALKNALIPTVTVAALETGSLLGGNMIVETVFGWPGL